MLSFDEFLNESKSDVLEKAMSLVNNKNLAEILNNCEEGKYQHVQIQPTTGADSYVGIAINDGTPVSEVYHTPDPKIALVAIVMKNTGKDNPDEISSILSFDEPSLNYVVFAGNRPMTSREIADRYNFDRLKTVGDAVPFYTTTSILKTY